MKYSDAIYWYQISLARTSTPTSLVFSVMSALQRDLPGSDQQYPNSPHGIANTGSPKKERSSI